MASHEIVRAHGSILRAIPARLTASLATVASWLTVVALLAVGSGGLASVHHELAHHSAADAVAGSGDATCGPTCNHPVRPMSSPSKRDGDPDDDEPSGESDPDGDDCLTCDFLLLLVAHADTAPVPFTVTAAERLRPSTAPTDPTATARDAVRARGPPTI